MDYEDEPLPRRMRRAMLASQAANAKVTIRWLKWQETGEQI